MREQWIFTKHTCTLAISRSSFAARVAFSSRLRYFLFRNVASSVAFCSTVKTVLLTLWGGMVTESESHRSGRRSKNNRKKNQLEREFIFGQTRRCHYNYCYYKHELREQDINMLSDTAFWSKLKVLQTAVTDMAKSNNMQNSVFSVTEIITSVKP